VKRLLELRTPGTRRTPQCDSANLSGRDGRSPAAMFTRSAREPASIQRLQVEPVDVRKVHIKYEAVRAGHPRVREEGSCVREGLGLPSGALDQRRQGFARRDVVIDHKHCRFEMSHVSCILPQALNKRVLRAASA
jgi:hypothetical protein